MSLRKIRSDNKASARNSDTLFTLIIFFPVTATAEEGLLNAGILEIEIIKTPNHDPPLLLNIWKIIESGNSN